YLYDFQRGESFASKHLKVEVTAVPSVVEQNEPRNVALPGNSFWYHRAYFPSDAAPASHAVTLEVALPYQVLTDLKFNCITFRPHPAFTLTVKNLEYEHRGVWRTVPGFSPVQRAAASRWCFPLIEGRRLRLVLEQPYPLAEGPRKVFVFGGRQFAACREEYLDHGIVLSPFSASPPLTVKKIKHRFANATCLSQPAPEYDRPMPWFDFELYKEEPDGTLSYLSSWSNLPYNRLWVKTVLKKDQPTGV
ncbi:MAG: hypothetical protein H5U03_08145, partial [Clostridia bacterium]|nr:hypothetical protein [Clostridia bacterium]